MKTYLYMDMVVPDGIYPDEFLDFWGGFYCANPVIRRRGLLFEDFLVDPLGAFHAVVFAPLAPADPRLLARQRALQMRFDAQGAGEQLPLPLEQAIVALEVGGARVSNGVYVEKLRHHTWPRRAQRRDEAT